MRLCESIFGCTNEAAWEHVYGGECTCFPNRMVFCTPCKEELAAAYSFMLSLSPAPVHRCSGCGETSLPPVISEL